MKKLYFTFDLILIKNIYLIYSRVYNTVLLSLIILYKENFEMMPIVNTCCKFKSSVQEDIG